MSIIAPGSTIGILGGGQLGRMTAMAARTLGYRVHVLDPDAETTELLATYPDGMLGRANDANADGSGNLVTGTLNLGPAPGASWWFSATDGWRLLDDDISNTNGPVVIDVKK